MKRPHHLLLTFLCTLLLRHLFLPSLFSQESASLYRRGATMMESTLPPAPESFSMVKYADVPFSHDDCGRLSFDGAAGLQIGYNALDLVGTLLHEEGNAVIYSYTADGGKYSARREGGEGLLYRGPFLYRSDTLGGLSLESVASPEGRLTPQGAMLHVTDHTGSVVAVVSGRTAEVVTARSYDAWGRVKEEYGDSGYRYGFGGKEYQYHDFGIPYSDFGARFYSPTLRRWLSPDPLSHKYLGSSHYAFCANNPVNIIDPDGRHLEVLKNKDGTYTVIGGQANEDKNVYKTFQKASSTYGQGAYALETLTNY